ncbi:Na+/H+ antiporter, CPA1 family protein [Pseudooceanicola batsensis HTCC2597]|uniref:Na+/H+ antiporter, CPA1 family protein n=1 Tax=Pseudooceanicola batsensis (strain ATCC BAA-863 / DSM 15984 / KCTC 12145 / HTCC2597) TaxID=252305 RepID=A3TTS6_PSEBH|nr:cation:proton antiporter [Pseudooceanicola batsensis]EAQ05053.1 Na+/H+ antiporter, CPA1 family protein [Pseudooceanicola batsensis HTCC2597]
MTDDAFFGFDTYHIILVMLGGVIILARWLPRLVSQREPAAAPLLILFGAAFVLILPEARPLPDPREHPRAWELISELTVIVSLFGSGMRIDRLGTWSDWRPTFRMLAVAMPLTILTLALLGTGIAGMTLAGAILLGAVLAPTDPVLAADVQVGPPLEGKEHPVRFTLTTEAALNDGLAFPFVYLGLIVAAQGFAPQAWLAEWVLLDVIYRIAVGCLTGWLGGKALGYVLFRIPGNATLAETGSGVVAIAGVLLCYGSTELVEGYGFVAVTVMGLSLRRIEQEDRFHRKLHDFCEAIEHALTAGLLVALGTMLPLLLADLELSHVAMALILLFVIRPLSGWVALAGLRMPSADRAIVSVYGVRGIGSIYYLCYAGSHIEFVDEHSLWSLVALVILASTLLHGFSVGWAMARATDR